MTTGSSDYHGPTHRTFSEFGAYDTYGLGEPQVPPPPLSQNRTRRVIVRVLPS